MMIVKGRFLTEYGWMDGYLQFDRKTGRFTDSQGNQITDFAKWQLPKELIPDDKDGEANAK